MTLFAGWYWNHVQLAALGVPCNPYRPTTLRSIAITVRARIKLFDDGLGSVSVSMPNTHNSPRRHGAVAVTSFFLALLLYGLGYHYQEVAAAIPYLLLFLTVMLGPLQVFWPQLRKRYRKTTVNHWRSEIGIWFVIWALIHVALVVDVRGIDVLWGSPWAFGATVSLLLAVILMGTSNHRVYRYLGPKAWKWHQSHATYLIFYLLLPHIWHRAYLIPGFPSSEPLHWVYLVILVIVPVLHIGAFIKVVRQYRRTGEYPPWVR